MAKGIRSKIKKSNRARLREEVIKPKLAKLQSKSEEAMKASLSTSTVSMEALMSQLNPAFRNASAAPSVSVVTVEDSSVGAYQPKAGGMRRVGRNPNRVARKMSRHNKAFP